MTRRFQQMQAEERMALAAMTLQEMSRRRLFHQMRAVACRCLVRDCRTVVDAGTGKRGQHMTAARAGSVGLPVTPVGPNESKVSLAAEHLPRRPQGTWEEMRGALNFHPGRSMRVRGDERFARRNSTDPAHD